MPVYLRLQDLLVPVLVEDVLDLLLAVLRADVQHLVCRGEDEVAEILRKDKEPLSPTDDLALAPMK